MKRVIRLLLALTVALNLVASLEEKGMKINNPDLAPFAEATTSVLTDNASTYGDLLDQLNSWKAER